MEQKEGLIVLLINYLNYNYLHFFFILSFVYYVISSHFKFLSLFNNVASPSITFLIWSQSVFSSNNIATHSTANLIKLWGLLFALISDISLLFNLSNYSIAF